MSQVIASFGGSLGMAGGIYRANAVTLADNQPATLGVDSAGNLLVNVASGGTAGTQYTDAAAAIANPIGTGIVFNQAGTIEFVSDTQPLPVTGTFGGKADNSAFVAGTTQGSVSMGFYHSTIDTVTDGRAAALAIDSKRNLLVTAGYATAATIPTTAFYQGGNAITSLPTAATAGNLTGRSLDKFGRAVNLVGTIRDLRSTQTTTISASTSETTIITAGAAGIFNDVVAIIISNTSATATRVDIRDATAGSVIGSIYVPAGDVRGFAIPGESVPQTTAANNWTAQSSASVTDLRVFAIFDKNK